MDQRNRTWSRLRRHAVTKVIAAGLIALLLGAFEAGYLGHRSEAVSNAPESAPVAAMAPVSVTVRDFSFSPNALSVQSGEQVIVTVTNSGPSPHTFTINGVADTGQIAPGTSKTAQFTAGQAGTLVFYCMIHGQATMSGRITVQAAAAPPAPAPSTAPPPATAPAAPQQQAAPAPVTTPPAVTMRPPSAGDAGLADRSRLEAASD